jgi:hypothetical protein
LLAHMHQNYHPRSAQEPWSRTSETIYDILPIMPKIREQQHQILLSQAMKPMKNIRLLIIKWECELKLALAKKGTKWK